MDFFGDSEWRLKRGFNLHLGRNGHGKSFLLILATAPVTEITMPAGEGVLLPGWDGLVRCPVADAHVPIGLSGWELETSPQSDKAQRDIRNRTRTPTASTP